MKKLLLLVLFFSATFVYVSSQQLYKVNVSALNVRDAATVNSNVIDVLEENDTIEVLNFVRDNWVEVKYNNKNGYVSAKYLSILKDGKSTEEADIDYVVIFLIIIALIFVIGIFLGLRKKIIVFRDFADLTKTFLLLIIPIITLVIVFEFTENSLYKSIAKYLLPVYFLGMLAWIVVSTYKDNRNVLKTLLALYVKIPISVIFLNYVLSFFTTDNKQSFKDQIKDKISAGIVLLFILKLVRYRVWRYKPGCAEYNVEESLSKKVQDLKQQIGEFE